MRLGSVLGRCASFETRRDAPLLRMTNNCMSALAVILRSGRRPRLEGRTMLAVVLCAAVAACATPKRAGSDLAAPNPAPPMLSIEQPDTPGPHPLVLMVPGCEAPLISFGAALFDRYGAKLKAEGFAAGTIGAYPCGAGDVDAAAIAVARALDEMRFLPSADRRRIHLIGWGTGGAVVLRIVQAPVRMPGLVSAVAFYPACPAAQPWGSQVTLLLLLGEKDSVAPADACRRWADESDGPGPVVITRYVGVGHGFDVAEAGDPRFTPWMTGAVLVHDASTAWQVWIDLLKFLRLDLHAT